MTKLRSYYASASYATPDAAVLAEVGNCCGFGLEKLILVQKSALLIVIMAEALQPEGVKVEWH